MNLAGVLFSQGFGSRRECAALCLTGRVRVHGVVVVDPQATVPMPTPVACDDAGWLEVDGQPWPVFAKALVLLNKPAGWECSRQPRHHPGVLELLPPPLRRRGVQPVGRLDTDTTGVLLLTDDGALIHRWTHPRRHLPKVYEARLKHPLDEVQLQALRDGVVLADDPHPVRAADALALDGHTLRLTLTEGRYHQVKRMVAAAGNRVEALHRSAFGALQLPPDLPAGHWRWLQPQQVDASIIGA